jgi:hypothetical protein
MKSLITEIFENQKSIYFEMVKELQAMKERNSKLSGLYEEHCFDEDLTISKLILDEFKRLNNSIERLESKMKEYREARFSKAELKTMKQEFDQLGPGL